MDAQEVIQCLNASEERMDSDEGASVAVQRTLAGCQTTSRRRVKKLHAIPQNSNQIIPNNKKAVDDSNKRSR
ncbi:hypothetical protein GBA52_024422 [Prunus armeniaca]|nr:hypothetical protein GBA52_024422 [Prunus armeniaca]